jgi:DNA ligase-associated metallophosphoesterase
MNPAPIHFRDERLMLDPAGAAYWPAQRTLIVSDLHLEKGSAAARHGSLLPPFDTKATLEKLQRLIRFYRPEKIVALGDSFHDAGGAGRMGIADRTKLNAMAAATHFIWITGNHDEAASGVAGESTAEFQAGPFIFRHQAESRKLSRETEISGHYHPKASVETRAQRISRPCFVSDGTARLMLPAFGAFTGGLDVRDPAIARLFPRGLRVFLLGQERLFSFSLGQIE